MKNTNISKGDILAALKKEQFEVVYQLKYNMETGRPTGLEALLRWGTSKDILFAPDFFIPLAEEYDVITPITLHVLETVCRDLCMWRKIPLDIVPVAINLSRLDLCKPDFVQQLFAILAAYEIESEYIHLELTETAFVTDCDKIAQGLRQLRAGGIKIAIDDFGKGYSSLASLKTLPVDIIKIDRLFLCDILVDSVTQSILHSILDLARGLQLDVVYEGIEAQEQVEYLKQFEFRTAQGFYYAMPLYKEEIEHRLKSCRQDNML